MDPAHPSYHERYRTGRPSSYLTEYRIASDHVRIMEAAQPAGDCSDPASSDLGIIVPRCVARHRTNVGGGYFEERIQPNGIILVAPNTPTDISVYDPHGVRFLTISAEFLTKSLEQRSGQALFDFGPLQSRSFRNDAIVATMDQLWAEAERGDAVSRLYADGAGLLVLSALLREAEAPPLTHRGGLAAWQVRRVTEMIGANLGSEMPLAALAAEVGLSPYHFARAFKTSTGKPPYAYQTSLRIERAKSLLEHSDQSVTDIAMEVGYESSQALARLFQRALGMSPSYYRRTQRT